MVSRLQGPAHKLSEYRLTCIWQGFSRVLSEGDLQRLDNAVVVVGDPGSKLEGQMQLCNLTLHFWNETKRRDGVLFIKNEVVNIS
jgi:hypothetical protein